MRFSSPFRSQRACFFLLLSLACFHLPVYLYGILNYVPYPPLRDAALRNPALSPQDATVVLSTISVSVSGNPDFGECLASWLKTTPGRIVVVTDSLRRADAAKLRYDEITAAIRNSTPDASPVPATFLSADVADKRAQIVTGLRVVRTPITVFVDDHTFPKPEFLHAVLPVFDDPNVGLCGTVKRVRRYHYDSYWANLANIFSIGYIGLHELELCASTSLDGGAFVVSGRAMVALTSIFQNEDFYKRFENENVVWPSVRLILCWLGIFIPKRMAIGDDNAMTHEALRQGYNLHFLNTEDALVETTLTNSSSQFVLKTLRWRRTTIRYNVVLLSQPLAWKKWPWSVWFAYVRPLLSVHFALDWMILRSFKATDLYTPRRYTYLTLSLYFLKNVDLLPHFGRHPEDFHFALVFPLFIYIRDVIHIHAALTFWDQSWSGGTHNG